MEQVTDSKLATLKAKRDAGVVAQGLYESMKGSSKGLEALFLYIGTIESLTVADAVEIWAGLGNNAVIEKEDEETAAETSTPEKQPYRHAINCIPDGELASSIFYDSYRRSYVMKNERGVYLSLIDRQLARRLKSRGLSTKKNELGNSEIDELFIEIEETNDVGYAGALAGYEAGILEFGQTRALITQGSQLVESEEGKWPMLDQVFRTLLGDEQIRYFYSWLHMSVRALDARTHAPGQAIAIAGKRGCGKSLCQQLITQVLGGRCARPYQFMTGETSFNGDLFTAEHLMIEDEANTTDIRLRKKFGSQIKNIVANKDQRLHGKGKDALMLQPIWRISITTNDDPEALMVLPPLEDGLEDKIMLFMASHAKLPMAAGTPEEKVAFWGALMGEMPAFMYFLRNTWGVPEEIEDPRYGVKHYHNPTILTALNALTPEMHMLMLIEAHLITDNTFWEGTQSELTTKMTEQDSPCAFEARKLFKWATAAGTYLGRLQKHMPERVSQSREHDDRRWRVKSEKFAQISKAAV